MYDTRRAILEGVAAGEVTPEEAARLLARVADSDAGPGPSESPPPADRESQTHAGGAAGSGVVDGQAIRRVRVTVAAGAVRIVGDPLVAEVAVEGSHTLRREGDVLVVHCTPLLAGPSHDDDLDAPAGSLFNLRLGQHGRLRFRSLRTEWRPTSVRVNPGLPLEVQVSAGSATVVGVTGPIRCDVSAGSVAVRGLRGSLDATVSAGSLSARGVVNAGESRIACDMGSVRIDLEPGSDVRIRARSSLGRADVVGAESVGAGEWVVGAGTAMLTVEANLGSVAIRAES